MQFPLKMSSPPLFEELNPRFYNFPLSSWLNHLLWFCCCWCWWYWQWQNDDNDKMLTMTIMLTMTMRRWARWHSGTFPDPRPHFRAAAPPEDTVTSRDHGWWRWWWWWWRWSKWWWSPSSWVMMSASAHSWIGFLALLATVVKSAQSHFGKVPQFDICPAQ